MSRQTDHESSVRPPHSSDDADDNPASQHAFLALDFGRFVTYATASTGRFFGVPASQVVGRRLDDLPLDCVPNALAERVRVAELLRLSDRVTIALPAMHLPCAVTIEIEPNGLTLFLTSVPAALDLSRRSTTGAEKRIVLTQELASQPALAGQPMGLTADAQLAIRQRDDSITTAAHDLKNPLAAITGFAQVLEGRVRRLDLPDAPAITVGLQQIGDSARRMAAIFDDLLEAVRHD